jgi:hypothetical protein
VLPDIALRRRLVGKTVIMTAWKDELSRKAAGIPSWASHPLLSLTSDILLRYLRSEAIMVDNQSCGYPVSGSRSCDFRGV